MCPVSDHQQGFKIAAKIDVRSKGCTQVCFCWGCLEGFHGTGLGQKGCLGHAKIVDGWFQGVSIGKRGIACFEGLQKSVHVWDTCVGRPFFGFCVKWVGDKSQRIERLLRRFAEMGREDEEKLKNVLPFLASFCLEKESMLTGQAGNNLRHNNETIDFWVHLKQVKEKCRQNWCLLRRQDDCKLCHATKLQRGEQVRNNWFGTLKILRDAGTQQTVPGAQMGGVKKLLDFCMRKQVKKDHANWKNTTKNTVNL